MADDIDPLYDKMPTDRPSAQVSAPAGSQTAPASQPTKPTDTDKPAHVGAPPAPSPPPAVSPQSALPAPPPQQNAVQLAVARSMDREGFGQNPYSSADGYGQFTRDTWLQQFRLAYPADSARMSDDQILAYRRNKDVATKLTTQYAAENAARFHAVGIDPTPNMIEAAHRLGPIAVQVVQAGMRNPDTPLAAIAPDAATKGNQDIANLTIGQFLADPYPRNSARQGMVEFPPSMWQHMEEQENVFQDYLNKQRGSYGEVSAHMREAMDWQREYAKDKPPTPEQTSPAKVWGSAAMMITALGGLLTHTPIATAMTAMAGVNEGFKEGDLQKAKTEYDRWKTAHEGMLKMGELSLKEAELAIKRAGTDQQALRAELEALSAGFQMDAVKEKLREGDPMGAVSILADLGDGFRRARSGGMNVADQVFATAYQRRIAAGEAPDEAYKHTLAEFPPQTGKNAPTAAQIKDRDLTARAIAQDATAKDDPAKLAELKKKIEIKDKLDASPYMKGLGPLERKAVDDEIARNPSVADDPTALGRVIRNAKGGNILPPTQVKQLEDHAGRIAQVMDTFENMEGIMDRTFAASTRLGKALRPGEAIGNILGVMSSTDRADFQRQLNYIRMEIPHLLQDSGQSAALARDPRFASIIAGGEWMDTANNVRSNFDWLQGILAADLKRINSEFQQSTGRELEIFSPGTNAKPTSDAKWHSEKVD